MPQGSSNAMDFRYALTSTFDGTMAVSAYQRLPVNAYALVHNKRTVVSQRIRADFGVDDIVEVGASGGGRAPFELDLINFSDVFSQLFGNTWSGGSPLSGGTGGTLTNGTSETYMDIEVQHGDLTNAFLKHASFRPAQLSLNIAANEIVGGDITFLGRNAASDTAASSTSVTAENAAPVVNATDNVGTLEFDDVAVTRKIRRIAITFNHNLSELNAVANKFAIGLNRGFFEVTGEIEFYHEDNALFDDFVNHKKIKLEVPFTDALGNKLVITVPRIVYTGGTPESPGVNQPSRQVMPFRAEHSVSMAQLDLTPI